MSTEEIVLSVIGVLFTGAFGLWARRLDKALDLLEKIQYSFHEWAISIEHRLTKLEAHKDTHGQNDIF